MNIKALSVPRSASLPGRLRLAAAIAAACGVVLAVYLTLRPSGAFGTVPWIPGTLARWADEYGRFRNFPAYALLAWPCLGLFHGFAARAKVTVALALLAGGLEFGQLFVVTRWVEYQDVVWSWAGVLATWFVFERAAARRRKTDGSVSN